VGRRARDAGQRLLRDCSSIGVLVILAPGPLRRLHRRRVRVLRAPPRRAHGRHQALLRGGLAEQDLALRAGPGAGLAGACPILAVIAVSRRAAGALSCAQ
jgi:hypothetical protein